MKKQLLTGALAVGTLLALSLLQDSPAQALSFGNGSATLLKTDVGQSFLVNIDQNNINGTSSNQVSSQATFTLTKFLNSVAGKTEAYFDIALKNTSALSSRVSVLGFDTNPNVNTGLSTVSGIFDTVTSGNVPNVGSVEICFTDVNCAGGGGGGVTTGTGSILAKLVFDNATLSQFTMSNFSVRYQDIVGSTFGNSGSGEAVGKPVGVPTPALLPGLIGIGVASLRKKKREEGLEPAMQEAEA
jgi:hypothetical protein